ncbi:MAG TPA: hypothetical protein PLV87_02930 [Opitutaceae bacterium]|nr:hypothetical protein [Opitutaceae bacterium]
MRDVPCRVAVLDSDTHLGYYDSLRQLPGIYLTACSIGTVPNECDVALLGDESSSIVSLTALDLSYRGIPTLHLPDGILEWRNTWTNPIFNNPEGRPLFQPSISSKIGCLGLWQALLLESFGNHPFRCEITGSPRLDYLDRLSRRPNGSVLIASARTPGFTPDEVELASNAMASIRTALHRYPSYRPLWRLSPQLQERLHLPDDAQNCARAPLADTLVNASAVITTPSTLALEAMRLRIPTLVVDFTNSPAYLLSAWRANSPDTLGRELENLLRPDDLQHQRRIAYQDFLLRLQLEPGNATERVGNLLKIMAQNPEESLNPSRLLLPRRSAYPEGIREFDMSALYPMIPELGISDTTVLQARLLHQRDCLRELEGYRRRRLVRFSDWISRVAPFLRRKPSGVIQGAPTMNLVETAKTEPPPSP